MARKVVCRFKTKDLKRNLILLYPLKHSETENDDTILIITLHYIDYIPYIYMDNAEIKVSKYEYFFRCFSNYFLDSVSLSHKIQLLHPNYANELILRQLIVNK